ncbi:flagellin [Teredinibacter waterburyi]|jgi:Flagellin and related hook-associated proteins|uniref:flagellin N-terminal helical domain-containing protein n=1 Tax=Teredinibacter waterburyi TaxID=1500538 RepID=UPI00165F8D74|nr:flagellin [Teredinibacter waterburyi]
MPLVINTNVAALNAQRQLVSSGNDMSQSMERLASGKRINTAADDAAGLAISNRMTSQVRGLDQAIRNANDGVSLIQTAEGALDEVTNILQRIRELAIQSANGIYADKDRATLDAEAQQLKAEIDRIADSTSFNGQPLLDGSLGNVALQVGAEAYQTIDLSIPGFSTSSLGGGSGDIVGEAATGTGLAALTALDAGSLIINDVSIGSTTGGTSLNDKISAMNASLDGKGAEVSTLISSEAGSAGSGVLVAGSSNLVLTLVDGDAATQTFTITGTSNMDELVARINSDTTVDASLNNAGKLILSVEGGQTLTVADGSASQGATGMDSASVVTNFSLVVNDTSTGKNGVKVEAGTISAAELLAIGIDVQDDEGNLVSATPTDFSTINSGDLIINGVSVGTVSAGADAATQAASVILAINKVSADTGVVAYAGAGTDNIELSSVSGAQISIKAGNGITADELQARTGFQERNAAEGGGSVSGISISTAEGAQKAIAVTDAALEQINATRSELGAVNNRLDFTMSNLSNVAEKTSAARSRIVDADFATETSQLSRAQVLQQASQAMLAQANAQPQQVLQLLQG